MFPRVVNAVNDGEIRADGEDEERDRNAIQNCAQNHQAEALWPFPETDAAAVNERLGTGLRIADHYGSGHGDAGEQSVKETVDGGVVDEKPHKNGEICVAVKHGFEKGAEKADARLMLRERAREQVTDRSWNQN